MKKLVCVLGTRPEAVKMAPVIAALKLAPWTDVHVVSTGQHREILNQTLGMFDIVPDTDLGIMTPDQTLAGSMSKAIAALDPLIENYAPDFLLAQGDTTSVAAAALCSFYRGVPFGHVEAGLRTGDLQNPFPEELNRVIAGRIASLHFAPTEGSRQNLLREGVPEQRVILTGNTVIDALLSVQDLPPETLKDIPAGSRVVLLTAHRRENHGEPLLRICEAVRTLHDTYPDLVFVFPVHPNPAVRGVVGRELEHCPRVLLTEPLDYLELVNVMRRSTLILTDSGGVQEEAPALSKPVLVLRETTERPEAVEAGVAELVGTDPATIVGAAKRLLDSPNEYAKMAKGASPYGDGQASDRIVQAIAEFLKVALQ